MPKASRSYYYAVRVGRTPGIYDSWLECEKQVKGYPDAQFKKFPTHGEANQFISAAATKSTTTVRRQLSAPAVKEEIQHTSFIVDMYTDKSFKSDMKKGVLEPIDKTEESDDMIVYTDGAASGNGTSSAYAGVGVYWGPNDPRNVSEPLEGKQTNQRAEIKAVIRAIETCENDKCVLNVHTDSMYTVNAVNSWGEKWQQNGWLTAGKKEVENKDLFERLFYLIKTRPGSVKVTHVPGHAGVEGNEMADRLAVNGAMQAAQIKRVTR